MSCQGHWALQTQTPPGSPQKRTASFKTIRKQLHRIHIEFGTHSERDVVRGVQAHRLYAPRYVSRASGVLTHELDCVALDRKPR